MGKGAEQDNSCGKKTLKARDSHSEGAGESSSRRREELGGESGCESQEEATETAQVRTVHLQLVQLGDSRIFSWLCCL